MDDVNELTASISRLTETQTKLAVELELIRCAIAAQTTTQLAIGTEVVKAIGILAKITQQIIEEPELDDRKGDDDGTRSR